MSRTKKKPKSLKRARTGNPDLVEYNHKLIKDRFVKKFPGKTPEQVGDLWKISAQTIRRILNQGNVSIATLREVTNHLDLNWYHVFDPKKRNGNKDDQFHRAVVSGDLRSVR